MALTQFIPKPKSDDPRQRVKARISLTSGHDTQSAPWTGPVSKTSMWAGKMNDILRLGPHEMVFSKQYEKLKLDYAPPFTIPSTAKAVLPVNTMISVGVKVTFSNKMTICTQAMGIVWPSTAPVAVIDDRFGVRVMIELHGIKLLPNRDMIGLSILRFYQDQFDLDELLGLISKMM